MQPRAIYNFGSGAGAGASAGFKDPVRAASTAPIVIGAIVPGTVMDTVVLAENDRILLKDQALGQENGFYVVHALGTVRASDTIISGIIVTVTEGFANVDKIFILTTDGTIVIGVTPLIFSAYGSSSKLSKGDIGIVALPTILDGDKAMVPGLAQTPLLGSNIIVFVSGAHYTVQDGPGAGYTEDCYFADPATPLVPRLLSAIVAGDELHWVGSIAGCQLSATDWISIYYSV